MNSWQMLHATCVIWMTGIIWVVQLLVYPSFLTIIREKSKTHHLAHTNRITYLVAPPMLIQLVSSGLLVFHEPQNIVFDFYLASALLLFSSTALIFVPLHAKLEHSWDEKVISDLVRKNWIRTILWSSECAVVFYTLFFGSMK